MGELGIDQLPYVLVTIPSMFDTYVLVGIPYKRAPLLTSRVVCLPYFISIFFLFFEISFVISMSNQIKFYCDIEQLYRAAITLLGA